MMSTQRVMAEIILEIPSGNARPEMLLRAGEALRSAMGSQVGMPPGLPAARDFRENTSTYQSSTGRLFQAAEGCVFAQIECLLEHPAQGAGPAGLLSAARLIEAAMAEFGATRALYGSCGVAESGVQDRFEARFWSPDALNELLIVAEMARYGLSAPLYSQKKHTRD